MQMLGRDLKKKFIYTDGARKRTANAFRVQRELIGRPSPMPSSPPPPAGRHPPSVIGGLPSTANAPCRGFKHHRSRRNTALLFDPRDRVSLERIKAARRVVECLCVRQDRFRVSVIDSFKRFLGSHDLTKCRRYRVSRDSQQIAV